ncbi:MAG: hypothetical protein O3B86_03015 [Planctomycetota bacterium]|nr:hypothetical protein [Planctomycetota bacterium]
MPNTIELRRSGFQSAYVSVMHAIMFFAGIMIPLLAVPALLQAQQTPVGPPGSSVNRSTGNGNSERVLVLRSGRVMQGRIKSVSTGWLVSTDRGHAVIPFGQVLFDADDLNEAYLRLRIQDERPTVTSHLRLADWCLSQDLLAEGARELRDALEKDSSNETARLMLDRVDTEIRRRTPNEFEVRLAQDVVLLNDHETQVEDTEVRSLSGLSPETARDFVSSIQPLLLNKCGNARCHGPSATNEFRLTRTRSGSSNSRIVSERNLAAVLNDLRPEQNGKARLLEVIRGSHAGQSIFNGRYGAVQMQTLQDWVKTASKELRFELASVEQTAFSAQPATPSRLPPTETDSSTDRQTDIQQQEVNSASGSTKALGQYPDSDAADERLAASNGSAALRIPSDITTAGGSSPLPLDESERPTPLSNVQRILQEARQHVRKLDVFDPEDFNRRFAGSPTQ